ncbi:hypothetical protein V8G54_028752 [Vigna mungo]|uniref:Plastocyanin-like domain-containing protein n=1 Tax=Vigna mungo TaxID=3915 RepID=A0AAQ3MT09_VIGMU
MAAGFVAPQLKLVISAILVLSFLITTAIAADIFLDWHVSTDFNLKPVSTDQPVITINGMFPGPLINATTNDVIRVNVFNHLDDPLLFTWYMLCPPFFLSLTIFLALDRYDSFIIELLFEKTVGWNIYCGIDGDIDHLPQPVISTFDGQYDHWYNGKFTEVQGVLTGIGTWYAREQ